MNNNIMAKVVFFVDFIFKLIGCYFSMKFLSYVSKNNFGFWDDSLLILISFFIFFYFASGAILYFHDNIEAKGRFGFILLSLSIFFSLIYFLVCYHTKELTLSTYIYSIYFVSFASPSFILYLSAILFKKYGDLARNLSVITLSLHNFVSSISCMFLIVYYYVLLKI